MGKQCAAIGCTNTSKRLKRKHQKEGITFHSFPIKHPDTLRKWIDVLKKKDFNPTEYSFLCSEHFEEDDFHYQPFTGMRMVKKEAVPSKLVFKKGYPETKWTSCEFGASVVAPEDDIPSHESVGIMAKDDIPSHESVGIMAKDDIPSHKSVGTMTGDDIPSHKSVGTMTGDDIPSHKSVDTMTGDDIPSHKSVGTMTGDDIPSHKSVGTMTGDDIPSHKSVDTMTTISMDDIATLITMSNDNEEMITKLTHTLKENSFSVNLLTDAQLKTLTGFDRHCFIGIYTFFKIEQSIKHKTKKCYLSKENQLFLTLLRLRQNLTFRFLSILFKIELCSVSIIFNKCISILYAKARVVNIWPPVEQIKAYMPPFFHRSFPSCRVILDATEFYIHKSTNPSTQQASFSTYKNFNTLKGLIGIAPSCAISFISDLWLGSISDKELTLRSGLLDKLERGDTVLADRGFTSLTTEFSKNGITLVTPTFLRDKIQFPLVERSSNKNISSHRVHVERAIAANKCFKILDGVIPLTMKSIDRIYFVCSFLCNFTNTPLITS